MLQSIFAKTQVGTFMVLSVAAGVLLAVAVPEPVPAIAQDDPPGGSGNTTELRVELNFSGKLDFDVLGFKYTLVPEAESCESEVTTTPPTQTEASGTPVKSNPSEAENDQLKHDLDYRCDWFLHWCGSSQEYTLYKTNSQSSSSSGSDPIIRLEKNPHQNILVSPNTGQQVSLVVFDAAVEYQVDDDGEQRRDEKGNLVPDEIKYSPCARLTIAPASGIVSATAAGVEYSFTTDADDCSVVNPSVGASPAPERQFNSDGFLDYSSEGTLTGGISHQLPVNCDWTLKYCAASIEIMAEGISSVVDDDGTYVLNQSISSEAETYGIDPVNPDPRNPGLKRLVDRLYHDTSGNNEINTILYTTASTPKCPSSVPHVALHDNSNSGADFDELTNVTEPTFLVTNVAAGSTVKVTAAFKSNGVVTKSVTKSVTAATPVPEAGVPVMFTGSTCDDEDADTTANDSCALDEDGSWEISATHEDTVGDKDASTDFTGLTILRLDTAAPVITITSQHPRLHSDPSKGLPGSTTIVFMLSKPILSFNSVHVDAPCRRHSYVESSRISESATL